MSSVATIPSESRYSKVSYLTSGVLIWFHVQAIAALWSFSWTNLFVAVFLYWVAVGLGISMGYHRLHTHRGFKTYRLFEYFLAVCGTLTLEGGPIFWVATHRVHHQHSDRELDPHTPRVSGFWAHLGWIGFGLLAIGGWGMVNWAIFLRVVVGLHSTWLVNSATHMWGGRRFATKDDSRNTWWVALLTFGEGWHNNHHAHPTSARHGLAWYEFDLSWILLKILSRLGIVRFFHVASVESARTERRAA